MLVHQMVKKVKDSKVLQKIKTKDELSRLESLKRQLAQAKQTGGDREYEKELEEEIKKLENQFKNEGLTVDPRGYKVSDQIIKGFMIYKSGKGPATFVAKNENGKEFEGTLEQIKKQIDDYWVKQDEDVMKQKVRDEKIPYVKSGTTRGYIIEIENDKNEVFPWKGYIVTQKGKYYICKEKSKQDAINECKKYIENRESEVRDSKKVRDGESKKELEEYIKMLEWDLASEDDPEEIKNYKDKIEKAKQKLKTADSKSKDAFQGVATAKPGKYFTGYRTQEKSPLFDNEEDAKEWCTFRMQRQDAKHISKCEVVKTSDSKTKDDQISEYAGWTLRHIDDTSAGSGNRWYRIQATKGKAILVAEGRDPKDVGEDIRRQIREKNSKTKDDQISEYAGWTLRHIDDTSAGSGNRWYRIQATKGKAILVAEGRDPKDVGEDIRRQIREKNSKTKDKAYHPRWRIKDDKLFRLRSAIKDIRRRVKDAELNGRAVWKKEDFDKMVASGNFVIVSKQPWGYEVRVKSGNIYGVEIKDSYTKGSADRKTKDKESSPTDLECEKCGTSVGSNYKETAYGISYVCPKCGKQNVKYKPKDFYTKGSVDKKANDGKKEEGVPVWPPVIVERDLKKIQKEMLRAAEKEEDRQRYNSLYRGNRPKETNDAFGNYKGTRFEQRKSGDNWQYVEVSKQTGRVVKVWLSVPDLEDFENQLIGMKGYLQTHDQR